MIVFDVELDCCTKLPAIGVLERHKMHFQRLEKTQKKVPTIGKQGMSAPDTIHKLVETFVLHKDHYKSANYNEIELWRFCGMCQI